jgi:hypothetical protein
MTNKTSAVMLTVAATLIAVGNRKAKFCRDLKGYAWVFRKSDFLNIGLGRRGISALRIT